MTSAPENDDFPTRVELPDHASAYFSPKPLPATSDHRTLETAAVRLHPSLDFDGADTQRLPVAPFLQDTVDRNAPTVLVRTVPRRRGLRAVFGAVAVGAVCLGGVLVWAFYDGVADPAKNAEGAAKASSNIPAVSSAPRLAGEKSVLRPSLQKATPEVTSTPSAAKAMSTSNAPSATSTAPSRAKPPARTASGRPPAGAAPATQGPAATTAEAPEPQGEPPKETAPPAPNSPEPAPKSWVKDEAPKSWVR